jgi:2-iminobutanoate/2-iminopropanoate deaminase
VYVSGQIAIDPISNEWVGGSIEKETHRVLKNIEAVLAASGSDLSLVLHCSIFVKDIGDYPVINEIYSEYFPSQTAPARALVEVSALPKGALVEMTVVAALKE